MANVVDKEKLEEVKEFSKNYEKLSEKDKGFVLGYMACMSNMDNEPKQKARK